MQMVRKNTAQEVYSLANLLSASALAAITSALQSVVDTFFKQTITLNSRTTVLDPYGESNITTAVTRQFDVLCDFSVGKSGRYQDVEKSPLGQRDEDSFHLFFWAADVLNSGIIVDPTKDSVTITGMPDVTDGEFEIRMFSPSALFSDLGYVLFDMELKRYGS